MKSRSHSHVKCIITVYNKPLYSYIYLLNKWSKDILKIDETNKCTIQGTTNMLG